MRHVLSIAGSDSSAGAGIQADLKTFAAHGVYGMTAITAITAQNTTEIKEVFPIPGKVLENQLLAIEEDIDIHGIKIGMIHSSEHVDIIGRFVERHDVFSVLDPILYASSGRKLVTDECIEQVVDRLMPKMQLVTPNCVEAGEFLGTAIDSEEKMKKACQVLFIQWGTAILLKGGHLKGEPVDMYYDGTHFLRFAGSRLGNPNNHGTGCTLSSAIAANVAKGKGIAAAIGDSKRYTAVAIENGFSIGRGAGPLDHFKAVETCI